MGIAGKNKQIHNILLKQITNNVVHPGSSMPTIYSLAEKYNSTYYSIKKIYNMLEKKGYITLYTNKQYYVNSITKQRMIEKNSSNIHMLDSKLTIKISNLLDKDYDLYGKFMIKVSKNKKEVLGYDLIIDKYIRAQVSELYNCYLHPMKLADVLKSDNIIKSKLKYERQIKICDLASVVVKNNKELNIK